METKDIKHSLVIWKDSGEMILNESFTKKTILISEKEGDFLSDDLGDLSIFVTTKENSISVLAEPAKGKPKTITSLYGQTISIESMNICITTTCCTEPAKNAQIISSGETYSSFLKEVNEWVAKPMLGNKSLDDSLTEYLDLVIKQSNANSGMLVLIEPSGLKLVSTQGLSKFESQKLWEKMPHSLAEEIIRTKAKILLPDELRHSNSDDTTLFIKGIKSLAGFPVFAEGDLLAIYYLGFDNILTELSQELQDALETSSDLLGLVVQRAQFREQIKHLSLVSKLEFSNQEKMPKERLMIGASDSLAGIYDLIQRFAPVDVPTLIQGETGTGKELAAKEIHRLSNRAKGPFVVVNAAALPESLVESELFGHKKGSFTGAISDRIGMVEQADGGTLFIDEIGELDKPMQAKLLRILQEHTVTRVGDSVQRPINFRLISATHQDLNTMIKEHSFREDLYYRIAGAMISLPALRDRKSDIVSLANHFKSRFAEQYNLPNKEWSIDAVAALEAHRWPGNIRELENLVSRAFVMAPQKIIQATDLGISPNTEVASTVCSSGESKLNEAKDAWMKRFIQEALNRHNGKRAETAKALGVGERTLFRHIDHLEIRE